MEHNFDKTAYIRKLYAHELGYRGGQPGKAGGFFLVSKKATNFFPPLSDSIFNDNVVIDVIPPFSDSVVLTKLVYHNDAISTARGSRNEYRLYLNTGINRKGNYFKPEDIVVIVKILSEDNNFIYKLLRYSPTDSEYARLNSILEAMSLNPKKTHALTHLSELMFLEELEEIDLGGKIIPQEIIDESFAQPVAHAPVGEEDKYEVTRIMRSRSFRDLVLYFYEEKGAITGEEFLISHKNLINLEAAHIIWRSAAGGSNPSNGIALERNLHWAFDGGFFTLTADYKVEVHPKAVGIPYLKGIHGREIFIPQDSRARPSTESIQWHRDNIFGRFLGIDA